MATEKKSLRGIIMPRFRIAAEAIPEGEFPDLPNSNSLTIFLTEPDPEKWPREMSHLKKYLLQED